MPNHLKSINSLERFYARLVADLRNPRSKLAKRMIKQSQRRIYEVEILPPWNGCIPWSTRYKDWQQTKGHLHKINQRLDQEMIFSRAWMEWENNKLKLCWLPRGRLHQASMRELSCNM